MIGGAGGKAVMALLLAILPLHVSHRNWAYVVHVIVTIQTLVVTLFLPHNFRSAIWILRCCGDGRRAVSSFNQTDNVNVAHAPDKFSGGGEAGWLN